jgi:PAS domain S-box-containing protein
MIAEGFGPMLPEMLRVFVVEDDMILTLHIQTMLHQMGFEAIGHARTGEAAVPAILSAKPDIVLMDIRLAGEQDGISTAEIVLESRDLPVVFATASADESTLDRVHLLNPYGFIKKPFEAFELRKVLQLAFFAHQKDKALRASEERWKFALEGSGDGIWDYDLALQRIDYSTRFADILGVAQHELDDSPAGFIERVHPDDVDHLKEAFTTLLRSQSKAVQVEFRVRSRGDCYLWVLARGKVITRSSSNRPLRVLGTLSEIQGQKEIEFELKKSEARYKELAETLPEIVFETDDRGIITFANSVPVQELMQGEVLPPIGRSVFEFLAPEDRRRAQEAFVALLKRGGVNKSEYSFLGAGGKRIPVMIHSRAILNDGKLAGLRGVVVNLTEQKEVERTLRQSQHNFQVLASNMPGIDVYLLDPDLHVTLANGVQLTGNASLTSALVGRHMEDAFPKEFVTFLKPACAQAHHGAKSQTELAYNCQWFDVEVVPISEADHAGSNIVVVCQNITRTKEAEFFTQQHLAFQQELVDAIPIPVFFKDAQSVYMGCNRAYETLAGTTRDHLIGKTTDELFAADLAARYLAQDETLKNGGGSQVSESILTDASGRKRHVVYHKAPFSLDGNGTKGVVGAIIDLTERLELKQTLMESEERYRTMFHNNHAVQILIDPESLTVVESNPAAARFYGYSPDTLRGMPYRQISRKPEAELRAEISAALAREATQFTSTHCLADGMLRQVEIDAGPVTIDGRNLLYIFVHDITELIRKEERIRIFSRALSQAREVVIITDRDGKIEYANPRFTEVTGYLLPEVIGQTPRILKSGETPAREYEELWRTIRSGERWNGVFHNKRKDGHLYWDRTSISPVKDADGVVTHFIAVKEDISEQVMQHQERLRLEQELREHNSRLEKALRDKETMQSVLVQSEKLASIGQLTAGIAHEINNPLAFVSSNLNRFQEYFDELHDFARGVEAGCVASPEQADEIAFIVEDFDKLMRNTRDGTGRIKSIVEQLRGFTHMADKGMDEADINVAVDDCISITWNELKYKATVKRDYGTIPPVTCNIGELKQVLVNLLVNAAHAIHDAGEIIARTRVVDDSVTIAIEDTGEGIPEEHLKSIFDPFFTTKPVGKGTGLGLWISATIISKHKGTINVASTPGKGSTFTVAIPMHRSEAGEDL